MGLQEPVMVDYHGPFSPLSVYDGTGGPGRRETVSPAHLQM